MEIFVSINGKYPRSEKLISATRDFDRNRISSKELLKIYEDDYKALREFQSDFKIVSDGLLNWQDLIRPFSELLSATVNGLKRYFETNTFYRTLKFKNYEIKDVEKFYENYFKFGNLAILPSLGLFKYFSENYNFHNLTQVFRFLVKFLSNKGYSYFYFQEPSLGFYKDYELLNELEKFFKSIRSETNAKIILNTYFSDISEFLDKISHFDIDGIGIDFTFNSIEDVVKSLKSKDIGIVAGIVDTTNSLIEHYEDVRTIIHKLLNDLNLKFLILTGSSDFEFLPREVADRKVNFLKDLLNIILP